MSLRRSPPGAGFAAAASFLCVAAAAAVTAVAGVGLASDNGGGGGGGGGVGDDTDPLATAVILPPWPLLPGGRNGLLTILGLVAGGAGSVGLGVVGRLPIPVRGGFGKAGLPPPGRGGGGITGDRDPSRGLSRAGVGSGG
jgi:hypothetical protein